MDVTEIKKWLPHRYPFLLVDRVVDLQVGESIVAYKNISVNEEVFGKVFERDLKPGGKNVLVSEKNKKVSKLQTLLFLKNKEYLYYLNFKNCRYQPNWQSEKIYIRCYRDFCELVGLNSTTNTVSFTPEDYMTRYCFYGIDISGCPGKYL